MGPVASGVAEQLNAARSVAPGDRAIALALARQLDSAVCQSPASVARELRALLDKITSAQPKPEQTGSVFDELARRRAGAAG
jgi:hypothetical protein